MNHLNHMNTKRFLAAILGICAGMAVLLAGDDFRASDFSRYLLASDDGTASTGAAAATSATSSAATSKGRVLQTEEPSRPMRILKVEEGTISDENRELIYLRPTTGTARSLKGATEGVSKDDVLRRVKEIMAHLDQNVEPATGTAGGDQKDALITGRSLHLLQLEFPDCVGLNEEECQAQIMDDLETNTALLAHLGGTTDDLQFEVRTKRHEDDSDHAKVVILTDDTGTKVVGTDGDSIVHYPYKWHTREGVEVAIGPWDCSVGSHAAEEGTYPIPLAPSECCSMILASIGGQCDDSGDCLECFVQKPEVPNKNLVLIVVDTDEAGLAERSVVVEDAIPRIIGR